MKSTLNRNSIGFQKKIDIKSMGELRRDLIATNKIIISDCADIMKKEIFGDHKKYSLARELVNITKENSKCFEKEVESLSVKYKSIEETHQ